MRARIGVKLMLGATVGVLAVVTAVSAAAYRIARRQALDAVQAHLESVAQSRAAHVETYLREHQGMIQIAASSIMIRDGLRKLMSGPADPASTVRQLNVRLERFLDPDGDAYQVLLLNQDGMVVASTVAESIGLDRAADPYFVGAQSGPFVRDAHLSAVTGRPGFAVSAPLFDGTDLLGVLVLRLDMARLNAITADHTGLGETGETYLINKYGFMITQSRFREDTFLKLKVDTANARECLADTEARRRGALEEVHGHVTMVSQDYRGVRVIGTHAHVQMMQWGLLAEIDTDEAFAPIARLKVAVVTVGLVSAALALLGSSLFARRIVHPIGELDAGSARIGAGELDYRLDIKTGDELEKLAQEFNRMAANLSASYASLEQRVADRTAELASANEEVKQFAYIVSHDLRAPLVNLKGFSAELRSALDVVWSTTEAVLHHLTEEQRQAATQACQEDIPEALGFIESSVTRMDGYINAVLTLSRAGSRELRPEPLNVEEIVRESLASLAHQIEERGVKVTVGPLPEVVADRISMEQIMGNLLTNAVNYLDPARRGEIEISGERGDEQTTFRIRDNGRGIAASDMEKVFAPFRRAGKQDVAGEGMGLAYVQTVVRRHGGRIWCESEPGAGTIFTFTIANHPAERTNHV